MKTVYDELYEEELIELIEDSDNCKLLEGNVYNIIIFKNKERSYIIYINKNELTIEENNISANLADDIISYIGQPKEIGLEKLLSVMLVEDFYEGEM